MDEKLFNSLLSDIVHEHLLDMLELGEMPNVLFEPSSFFGNLNSKVKRDPAKSKKGRRFFRDEDLKQESKQDPVVISPPPILSDEASDAKTKGAIRVNYHRSLPFLYYELISPPSVTPIKADETKLVESSSNVRNVGIIESVDIQLQDLSAVSSKDPSDIQRQVISASAKNGTISLKDSCDIQLRNAAPVSSKDSSDIKLQNAVPVLSKDSSDIQLQNASPPISKESCDLSPQNASPTISKQRLLKANSKVTGERKPKRAIEVEEAPSLMSIPKKGNDDENPLSDLDDDRGVEDRKVIESILEEGSKSGKVKSKKPSLQDFVKRNKEYFEKDDDIVAASQHSSFPMFLQK